VHHRPGWTIAGVLLAVAFVAPACAGGAEAAAPPSRLKVALVQMALADSIAANRDRVVTRIGEAAARGARVVAFPEGTVCGEGGRDASTVDDALAVIRRAAKAANVYILLGGKTWSAELKKDANWMCVIGPNGRDLLRYEKLYDNHRAAMPGVFFIDGIPCHAMICADRWLRGIEEIPIQQGAQLSFELSNNFASEWVAPLEWYWYVPRAMPNNVRVLFVKSGNEASIVSRTAQHCHLLASTYGEPRGLGITL